MVRDNKPRPRPSSPVKTNSSSSTKPPTQPPTTTDQTPKQPGLLTQVAANAVGVGVGSAVGHVIGNALVGSGSKQASTPPSKNTCEKEMRDFIDCGLKSESIGTCQEFLEAFKRCRQANNINN